MEKYKKVIHINVDGKEIPVEIHVHMSQLEKLTNPEKEAFFIFLSMFSGFKVK